MIPVTKPFLPPVEEYEQYVRGIWQRNWLTNNGPLVNLFELELKEFFGLKHTLFLSNGTVALQIACKALELKGEVITTPFSYVATVNALVWEGLKPVFVDIDPCSLNIDPERIEAAITSRTSAILATHVYGNPCDIDAIEEIARRRNLKVIFDAAHCFGTTYKGKSVFRYGDVSTTSFHATKLFHTIEGGAVFTEDPELLRRMALMRNFGHIGTNSFDGQGINAKNSELHAAMGLVNLRYVNEILRVRRQQWLLYHELLEDLTAQPLQLNPMAGFNYAYYPLILGDEEEVIENEKMLNVNGIFPRRYFFPSLNRLAHTGGQQAPISEEYSRRVICLPLYHELSTETQHMISRLLLRIQNYHVS